MSETRGKLGVPFIGKEPAEGGGGGGVVFGGGGGGGGGFRFRFRVSVPSVFLMFFVRGLELRVEDLGFRVLVFCLIFYAYPELCPKGPKPQTLQTL